MVGTGTSTTETLRAWPNCAAARIIAVIFEAMSPTKL